MSEKCRYAYRKRGMAGVFCKQLTGDQPFCSHQYFCHVSQRWEANKTSPCTLRNKPPIEETAKQ